MRYVRVAAIVGLWLLVPCAAFAQGHGHHAAAAAPSGAKQARAERRRALERERAGACEPAIEAFQHAEALAPNPDNLFRIARCYVRLDRSALAIEYLERALAGHPPRAVRTAAQALLTQVRSHGETHAAAPAPAAPASAAPAPSAPATTPTMAPARTPSGQAIDVERAETTSSGSEPPPLEPAPPPPPTPAASAAHATPAARAAGSATPSAVDVELRTETTAAPSRHHAAAALSFVVGAPITSGQAFPLGTLYAASFVWGLDPQNRLRVGADVTFGPPNGVTWLLQGSAGFEYGMKLFGMDALEGSARFSLGLTMTDVLRTGLVLPPGTYSSALARLGVAVTYRFFGRWLVRAVPAALDWWFIDSTPSNVDARPILRYRAEVGVGATL